MIGIIIIIALLTVYAMIFYSLMKAAKKADEEININTKNVDKNKNCLKNLNNEVLCYSFNCSNKNNKWHYLAKHSKRLRIRKKYNKLLKEVPDGK